MLNLLKGMGKAYTANKKAKQADKLYQSKRTDVYGPNQNLSEDTKKLNKQLKTLKKAGVATVGTIGMAAIAGKVKQNKKDKKANEERD
jgi:histidyl-tRNA synthetase